MILIPEIETVVILTPRTGSGSLRRAIAERYPRSMLIYRHMEADGVPQGYDRWRKLGVVRHPVERLWSLYKFCSRIGGPHDSEYLEKIRASVRMPFSDWILKNETVFTSPYVGSRFFTNFTVRHPLPETRKSQYFYLRPDLGTEVVHFNNLSDFFERLGLSPRIENRTAAEQMPELSAEATRHCEKYFEWDFQIDALIDPVLREAAA